MNNLELRIFFSWQMSTLNDKRINNKTFLIKCLEKAISKVNKKEEFRGVKFVFDEGLLKTPGDVPVADTCLEKIKHCHIYVADFTIESSFNQVRSWLRKKFKCKIRSTVNNSVLIEYGYAKANLEDSAIILVMNTIKGNPNKIDDLLPFDIRHNRHPIVFEIAQTKFKDSEKNGKKFKEYEAKQNQLIADLTKAIQLSTSSAIQKISNSFLPFISCKKATERAGYKTDFKWTPTLTSITEALHNNQGIIRLVGLSGLGKTRLVLESMLQDFNPTHKLYCDMAVVDETVVLKTVETLFDTYSTATLILDNCQYYFLEKIYNLRQGKQATNPIVAIYNDPNEQIDNLRYQPYRLVDSDEIVEDIIQKYAHFFSPAERQQIVDFSGGIPLMAELLIGGWQKTKEVGKISNQTLVSKLLGTTEKSENRLIAQSLSLFNSLGVEDGARKEMVFVATNKNITSIDGDNYVIVNKFDILIHDYLSRRLLERKGRYVCIRPLPIAWYLMCEWLKNCSKDRLINVLEDIRKSEVAASIAPAFGAQFINMPKNSYATNLLNDILGAGSPFSDAEVINTEVGSRLFRSFVEVTPQAVANCLYCALVNKSIDELKGIEAGRRNLIWTIEKLCFDPTTFVKGAKIMLRLGCAETEYISNNATGQFLRLFPIYLPATAVSLEKRMDFLRREIKDEEQKAIVLRAVNTALNTGQFFYFHGPEMQGQRKLENYRPSSQDEVKGYIVGCLDIIYNEIYLNTEYLDFCTAIISDNFRVLCAFNMFDTVIPYVSKVAEKLNYKWDSMKVNLYMALKDKEITNSEQHIQEVKSLINKFTKDTFVERFSMVEKFYAPDFDIKHIDTESDNKRKIARYEELAVEMATNKLYTKEILRAIYNCKTYKSQAFGRKLAVLLSEEEQVEFIQNSLDVLPEGCTSIIVDFMAMVDEKVFLQAVDIIKEKESYSLLFPIVAIRDYKFQGEFMDMLFDMVSNNHAEVSNFRSFWNYSPIKSLTSNEAVTFLERLLKLPNSFEVVLHMVFILLMDGKGKENPKIEALIEEEIMKTIDKIKEFIKDSHYSLVLCSLLRSSKREVLAKRVMSGIIDFIVTANQTSVNYNVEEVLCVLLEYYFDVSWNILAKAMSEENDERGGFSHLYWIFGNNISLYNKYPSLIATKEHEPVLLAWCEKNPDVNAYRLMSIVPLLDGDEFSDIVMKILDRYGDRNYVITALEDKLGSFASNGSALPIYNLRIKLVESLIKHSLPQVSSWAIQQAEKLTQKRKLTACFEDELTIPGRIPSMNGQN